MQFELKSKTKTELRGLYRHAFKRNKNKYFLVIIFLNIIASI